MENRQNNQPVSDPASVPESREGREAPLKQPLNKLQFEEAVQRLHEEYERHPKPAKGIFY